MKKLMLVATLSVASSVLAVDWIASADRRTAGDSTSFLTVVTNRAAVTRAVWKTAGLGVYQAFVNGREIGGFLKPGFTHVAKCRHVYTFDVTDKFKTGAGATNVLSATVTSGWWRDGVVENVVGDSLPYEDELDVPKAVFGRAEPCLERFVSPEADNAFWGELTVSFSDDSTAVFGTGPSWRASRTGAVFAASIYGGETYDARTDESWRETGTADWPLAKTDHQFAGGLRPAAAAVTLRTDLAMAPREMHLVRGAAGVTSNAYGIARTVGFPNDGEPVRIRPGEELVVDFGQNAAAVCEIDVEGPAGAVLNVRHAEMLNEGGGAKDRGNDGPEGTPYVANLRGIPAKVRYTLREGRQTYRPSYSFFGFRYVGLTATEPVVLRKIRSLPVTSVRKDLETGELVTGNADVNRLVSNIRWGMYSNYLSVPTDCPQRNERVGWSGDTLAFLGAALYNADVYGFLSKWMADMRDSQFPDGAFRSVAPIGLCGRSKGMSGWADAGVAVPYRLWQRYGDPAVVAENWEAMVRYLDCLDRNGGHLTNRCGDWLSYEKNDEPVKRLLADALWIVDARMMAEMAGVLEKKADAERYRRRAEELLATWRTRYLDGTGMVREELRTQTTLAYSLKYGLVTEGNRSVTLRQLVDNIHSHGDRLQTGFLGTAVLPDVLSDNGEHELAVTLLLQRQEPSWLYSVDQGATTIWERWNSYTKEKGFGPVSMNSFNHYAYGAVLGWMYASLAGIREDPSVPGMSRFVLCPRPDRRLGFVSARYRTRRGVIVSSWRYEADGSLSWHYEIPEGTQAEVRAPGETSVRTVGAGAYDQRIEPPRETPVRAIGGLTKAFTAALVLTCVAEDKLDLDASVRRYLGPTAPDVTLRQALSCTAGFRKGHPCYPANALTVDGAYDRACRERLEAPPGTRFEYGPWGYYLAAKAVETVLKTDFRRALAERILKPYGLVETTFVPTAAMVRRIPPEDRGQCWLRIPAEDDRDVCAADCGLFSTEADLARFAQGVAADPRMRPLFVKQTPDGVERSFSFGLNVLPSGEAFMRSAAGTALRLEADGNQVGK